MNNTANARAYLFNMILLFQEDTCYGLKDLAFKNKICEETGMSKEYYEGLIDEYWGE